MYTLKKTISQRSITYIAAMLILVGVTDAWAGEITKITNL